MNKRQKKKQFKKQEIIRKEREKNNNFIGDQIIEERRQKKVLMCGKTEKLSRKKEDIIDEVIFDQYSFQWKIYYHTDNEDYQKEFCIGASNNLSISPQTQNKINIYKRNDIDKNLVYAISAFNNCHEDSTALRDLLTDSLKCKVVYNLSRRPRNMHITEDTLKKVKEGALSEKKRTKARVMRLRTRIVEGTLVGLALLLGIAGIGSSMGKKKHNTNDGDTKKTITIVTTTEESLTETEEIANTTIEEVSKMTTEATTQEQTTEEVTTEATTQEEIIEEKIKDDTEVEKTNSDIKLNDSFKLENTTLVDSTKNPRKKAHTSKLRCDEYKIALTAVLINNKIVAIDGVEELENASLKEIESKYKETYGEDAQVYVNFNGYKDGNQIYKYIGWGHIDEFKNMKTSNNQNTISKLKQIKNKLLSSKSLQKTYKI